MSTTMTKYELFGICCLGFALWALGACTTKWRDETKGLDKSTTTTTTTSSGGGGGGGGGGPCISCSTFFTTSSTCQAPDCPAVADVCAGPSRDALEAFLDCAFCDSCSAECPGLCGSDDLSGVSGACQGCLIGTLGGACAAEYGTCSGS